MRIESCRKCGFEMAASNDPEHKCVVCSKPTKMFCNRCNLHSEIQFHTHTFDVYSRKQLVEMEKPQTHSSVLAN